MKYSSCLWLFMSTCVSFVETFLFYVYCQYWCILCPSKKKVCARACMCTHVLKRKNKNCWLSSPFYNHLTQFNNRSPVFYFNNIPVTDWLWPPFKHTYIAAGHARTRTESSPWQEEDIYIYIWYRHLQWFLKFLLHKIWWTMKNRLLCHPNYTYMHQNFNKVSNLTTVVVFQNHSSTSRHVNCSSILGFQFQIQFLSECRTRCRITRKQCRVSLRA